jgi:magnesium-transporting ATPase (P-type)
MENTFLGVLPRSISAANPNQYSLNENHLLLKGSVLKNTKWVFGFVVYTGNDTKLMQNQQKVRFK